MASRSNPNINLKPFTCQYKNSCHRNFNSFNNLLQHFKTEHLETLDQIKLKLRHLVKIPKFLAYIDDREALKLIRN